MDVYTVTDLAKHWKVNRRKVLTFIASGELKAFDLSQSGRKPRWRIKKTDVEDFEMNRLFRKQRRRTQHAEQGAIDFASQRKPRT